MLGSILGACGLGLSAGGVAIPDIAAALHTRQSSVAWVVNCFALGLGVGTVLTGRLLDLLPTRRVADGSAALMVAGALMSATAASFAWLLAGRLLVGLGAGGLCSVAFVLGTRRLEAADRSRLAGLMTATSMSFIGTGPLLGAGAMAVGGWRTAMLLPALSVLPTLPFRRDDQPSATGEERRSIDLPGIFLVTVVAASVTGALQASGTGAGAKLMALLGALAFAGVALLVRHIRRHPNGFLPAELARHREFMFLNGGAMTLLGSYSAMLFAGPILLRDTAGLGPVTIGIALVPAAAAAAVAARAAERIISRYRPTAIVMALCGVAGCGLLLASAGTGTPVVLVAATALTVSAFAAGQATMQAGTPTLVAPAHVGVGLGVFNFFFITGAAIGTSATAGSSAALGFPSALLILSAMPLLGAALAYAARRAATRPSA